MEWIDVKDRLPDDEQRVYFFRLFKHKKSGDQYIGKFWANKKTNRPCFSNHNTLSYVREGLVTHWMPLLSPPQSKPNEESNN